VAGNVLTAIKAAEGKIGAPYVWGATGPGSFDCSGLMVWAWHKAGIDLPRTSQAQAKVGKAVPPGKIRPGDLVTSNWGSGPASHVAMYIGGGRVIHAPRPGRGVTVANLDKNYRSKVDSIRRIPGTSVAGISEADLKLPSPGDIWDWEKGWGKKLLEEGGGVLGDLPGLGDTVLVPLKIVAGQLESIGKSMMSIGQFAEFLLKLALPSTWVRIGCGLLGSVVLFLGLFFLIREARGAG
jgi:hypothetical protein